MSYRIYLTPGPELRAEQIKNGGFIDYHEIRVLTDAHGRVAPLFLWSNHFSERFEDIKAALDEETP
jgi:hypothetical protein